MLTNTIYDQAHKIRTLPQREFLNSLSQKVSSINAERDALAEALEKSEVDRQRVVAVSNSRMTAFLAALVDVIVSSLVFSLGTFRSNSLK
jgi:hypothetical protein